MTTTQTRCQALRANWGRRIEFLIHEADGCAAQGLTFVKMPEGSFLNPTFSLDEAAAQELMDSLWQCGLRPSEGTGSAGALAATQKHLEDMRSLVFAKNP